MIDSINLLLHRFGYVFILTRSGDTGTERSMTERIEYAIHTKRLLIELVAEFSIKFSYLHRIHRKNIYEHDTANMERA